MRWVVGAAGRPGVIEVARDFGSRTRPVSLRELDNALNQQPLPLTGEAPSVQAAGAAVASWRERGAALVVRR